VTVETTKIKVKFGNNEFEAEGPAELVKEQFESFKQLISTAGSISVPGVIGIPLETKQNKQDTTHSTTLTYNSIMEVSGRIISLTALPKSTEDAALVIMLGHKELKSSSSVTAQEIGDGLEQSGRPVLRVDRIMEKSLKDGLVLKTGVKRSTRYRLTNPGFVKSLAIAKELIDGLP
jgi:hypothetical protein